ncbi:MAG: 5-oxoprolinase [Alphaproteobacteria bacterium]|nr:5-oxoprolinase [Alphaproteobacteria bacterium]
MTAGWRFWIDRGGTFTDVVARQPDGAFRTVKLLSEHPERYPDAALAGIRMALGLALDAPLPVGQIDEIRMGTTVATNALLERKGARTLLVITAGFADLLEIGHQARPKLFDLDIRKLAPLYERVEEISARVDPEGRELAPLDETAVRAIFKRAVEDGFEACAIALMHAWKHPQTERHVALLAREAGFGQLTTSHVASPLAGLLPRAQTTVADAYLSPVLRRYVDRLAGELGDTKLRFMQSNGGLADAAAFQGKDAILSGPAGGMVGAARTGEAAGFPGVIGFDMGGTSTDVCLYAGQLERTFDSEVAGVALRTPMMAIHTVAAGGGSILHFDGARFRVGPDSAGADPGPACYRRGGPLTVTDANVLAGKIQPSHFPSIFGPSGDQPIDVTVVEEKFAALAAEVERATGLRRDPRDIAEGLLRIAVANMAQAVKQVSLEKGHDAASFALQSFGGAGGQHACLVADELGVSSVLIHPMAGVLSAYGMGLADQSLIRQRGIELPLDEDGAAAAERALVALAQEAVATLAQSMTAQADLGLAFTLDLRYQGADTSLPVNFAELPAMRAAFDETHRRRFGFATPERALIIEAVHVEASVAGEAVSQPALPESDGEAPAALETVTIWSGGRAHDAPVYDRAALRAGDRIEGPALIRETIATTVVEPGWLAETALHGDLLLKRTTPRARPATESPGTPDPVRLELFNNLFMAAAERMGAVLRNTSTSVNIKERLDFSCALFDASGGLIANAPHVPVHLGAMGESVRAVLASRRDTLKPGDMIALNNPFNGGTHLPDVTVIAPVFDETGQTIRFFVGNRGHHADIGGGTPGSTPPDSTRLPEEGVVIDNFLLRQGGEFREDAFRRLLADAEYPARNPDTNVSDIKAQIAANEAGIRELGALVARYGWPTVETYMGHVMANAEESVRRVIDWLIDGSFDYEMDDGSHLRVRITVDHAAREAVIDFTGTDGQRPGNFNAPPAVTRAAVLYVFRCLIEDDLPLNEGCLKPLRIIVPEGTFLSPAPGCAVVAGNTEVSQAICNALLGALGASAASQGTMNNLLIGNDTFQYYETICGGAGAGPGFDGASAVHTHMTNTRITDPEIMELRLPVRVEQFSVRRGSGGDGEYLGGDGAIRKIRALARSSVSIVSSRRTVAPFGLSGGKDGACGREWIERADGTIEPLGGVAQAELAPGDAIVIETPGGGGWGRKPGIET